MQELVANTEDAAQEKHVPVITVDGSTVRVAVGSVEHPMIEKHYIQWIYLQTTHGGQRYILKPRVQLRSPLMLIAICTDCGRQSCNICRLTFIKHFFSQCRSPDR